MNITLELIIDTLYLLDSPNRIRSTHEPDAKPGPAFFLIRNAAGCLWAARAGLPAELAAELDRLAREEPPVTDFQAAPVHADRYKALIGGVVHSGPEFSFPQVIPDSPDIVLIEDERVLARHFSGWILGEIAVGRAPVTAILDQDYPVSLCCCSRRSNLAAEAGLETAAAYRGRGLGARVTAAWARLIRAEGLIPLYSTDWTNAGSLAVARKLGLEISAVDWSISG
jgi:GNAT superfamily N-acetyltransferase